MQVDPTEPANTATADVAAGSGAANAGPTHSGPAAAGVPNGTNAGAPAVINLTDDPDATDAFVNKMAVVHKVRAGMQNIFWEMDDAIMTDTIIPTDPEERATTIAMLQKYKKY
eukprot:187563-Chlamydomonas_euryale.AAC.1